MGLIDTQFEVIEVKSNGVKDYFLEGFVSTTDPDLVNDIVTEKAQSSILNQLNNMNITVDDDHDSHRDNKTGKMYDRTQNKIPLALIVQAEMRKTNKNSMGTWVRAKLNKDYPLFDNYLNSIKNKFVHSFSIAYKAIEPIYEKINGTVYRIIDNLNIRNIGATGSPVNGDACFELALKSFSKKMEEDKKIQELETINAELKSSVDTLTQEKVTLEETLTQLNSEMSDKEEEDKKKKKEEEDKEEDNKTEVKSLDKITALEESNQTLIKEVAELKSFVESPQLKSIVEAKSKLPQEDSKKSSMWDNM